MHITAFDFHFYSLPPHIVVIEKTSPHMPVEVAPEASTSSASQVIAPTQVTGRRRIDIAESVEETGM